MSTVRERFNDVHGRRRPLLLSDLPSHPQVTDIVNTLENDPLATARLVRETHVADARGHCTWCLSRTGQRLPYPCEYAAAAASILDH